MSQQEEHYLVRGDLLPEALLKTVQAKELLDGGTVKTVHEAVEQVGLSRSAFYKYKDGILPYSRLDRERIVTLSLDLEHRSGILSRVLAYLAGVGGNVLTINQTIPLQGVANVVLSVDVRGLTTSLKDLTVSLKTLDGVRRSALIGQG